MKAAILVLTLAAIPLAHAVRCDDFANQEEAQRYLYVIDRETCHD